MGVLVIVPGCTVRCVFCSPPDVDYQSQPYKETVQTAYENLDRFISEGHKTIRISGNDPIEAEKDLLFDFIDRASKGATVELATNGIKCADEDFTRELIERGISKFEIPIYGSTEEIHQSVMHNGSLSSILKGFDNIVRFGGRISTLTAITKKNADDIINIFNVILSAVGEHRDAVNPMVLSKIGIPYIGYPGLEEWYLRFGEFVDYLPGILEHVESDKILSSKVYFTNIPYCAFGKKSKKISNYCNKEYLLNNYKKQVGTFKPALKARSTLDQNVPSYRVHTNPDELCAKCVYVNECAGVPENDYKLYGIGKLKPIEKT